MADTPTARDVDRLPWLEPFGESERKRARKPVPRTALVGLLIAFFGVGLAVAFSLGYRVATPPAEPSASVIAAREPEQFAAVQVPPPAPAPRVETVAPPVTVEPPVAAAPKPKAATTKPVVKKARARAKAKAPRRYAGKATRYAKRQPILRPFDLTRRPPPPPAAPYRSQPPPSPTPSRTHALRAPTPRGRVIQLGAYSTPKQADAAWRSLVWRYPYLGKKPKVIAPTPPVGGWQYYRLRLGTQTQAQSAVICQRLRARGQSCIVIY